MKSESKASLSLTLTSTTTTTRRSRDDRGSASLSLSSSPSLSRPLPTRLSRAWTRLPPSTTTMGGRGPGDPGPSNSAGGGAAAGRRTRASRGDGSSILFLFHPSLFFPPLLLPPRIRRSGSPEATRRRDLSAETMGQSKRRGDVPLKRGEEMSCNPPFLFSFFSTSTFDL